MKEFKGNTFLSTTKTDTSIHELEDIGNVQFDDSALNQDDDDAISVQNVKVVGVERLYSVFKMFIKN